MISPEMLASFQNAMQNGKISELDTNAKKLAFNEAKLVAKSIKVDDNLIHEEMALCDIYALKEEIDLPESNLIPQKNKIGF